MRGEVRDDLKAEKIAEEGVSPEKQQEILLMNKYASGGKLPPKSQSTFLQKKLQQRKFFDSGDYAMNQNKEKKQHLPSAVLKTVKGVSPKSENPNQTVKPSHIPTVLEVVAQEAKEDEGSTLRPISISGLGSSVEAAGGDSDEESHLQIPRPDTVPQRKASILHPSVHSKLSPQPHIHHDKNDELIAAPPE